LGFEAFKAPSRSTNMGYDIEVVLSAERSLGTVISWQKASKLKARSKPEPATTATAIDFSHSTTTTIATDPAKRTFPL
jgi:hypothetical protein